jgi:hypothetical protein
MEWLIIGAGVLLILIGLLDVFFTVLHYDGFGFLSSRLYRRLFDVVCFLTAARCPANIGRWGSRWRPRSWCRSR